MPVETIFQSNTRCRVQRGDSRPLKSVTLLTEVCHNVSIEPGLQPISNEILTGATANTQDGARLDIAAYGFWGGTYEKTFFDVRVFNPHAPLNRRTPLSSCYRKHEQTKKHMYKQRCREVEHASFTPLEIAATGGQRNHNILQKIGLNVCLQMGHPLQQHIVLATMPTRFFTVQSSQSGEQDPREGTKSPPLQLTS